MSDTKESAKLAAIRAHLHGVDVAKLIEAETWRASLVRMAKEGTVHARDHLARRDLDKMNRELVEVAPALLAAAREALEP